MGVMKENPGGLLYEKIRVDYYTQSALIFPRGNISTHTGDTEVFK